MRGGRARGPVDPGKGGADDTPRPRRRHGPKAVRVLASQVAKDRASVHALLALSRDCPDAMKGPINDVELRRSLPSADKIALAELTLPNQHNYLMILRTMSQRMLAAIGPRVVYKFARKVEDHLEPGDTRLIHDYLVGQGFFEPAAPMTEDERTAKMKKQARFEQMTLSDLMSKVLDDSRP